MNLTGALLSNYRLALLWLLLMFPWRLRSSPTVYSQFLILELHGSPGSPDSSSARRYDLKEKPDLVFLSETMSLRPKIESLMRSWNLHGVSVDRVGMNGCDAMDEGYLGRSSHSFSSPYRCGSASA